MPYRHHNIMENNVFVKHVAFEKHKEYMKMQNMASDIKKLLRQ